MYTNNTGKLLEVGCGPVAACVSMHRHHGGA